MKSWSETLVLAAPLRDVRLVPAAAAAATARATPASADPGWPQQLEESYQRGRIEGERALGEQLIQQRAELQELFQGVLEALRNAVPQVLRESEQAVIELALELARKIVADLPITPEMITQVVRDALTEVEGGSELKVRLHPLDLELLEKHHSGLLTAHDHTRKMCFIPSPEVTRGGCMIETNFGVLDARRESKCELLKQSLLG